ncbi:HAMP domain-containing protein [Sinorhizobium meliloti]|uniref:ATP-binding protein n=1 Tax=Rhizobium meliloti TaxID=382 RepID=UPI001295CE0E|nr:ATP-binding protein [Sinorhizobium meliloti]MDW9591627.1 HAMP domain-containing protein [Sinorhizobium meliloti]MDX0186023.1 HAMP domain-containing protein [Sinorhizobium meliloti]MDX0316228.1 HAMP domain-containing protein [Sinorhizobium meliloti]MDX0322471.1 HAMP domain-containing protein [Sinorhizobium meliloti]MQV08495.1 HAMP domain-containing protein [Sinorhizobium meliloti]
MAARSILHGIHLWPRTLRARLFVILLAGLTIAHAMSFAALFSERYIAARSVMFNTLETDVATSIAILDRLPATERAAWLGRLERGSYRFVLGRGLPGSRVLNEADVEVADKVRAAIGAKYPIEVESIPGGVRRLQAHLRLSDGEPLTIDITPRGVMPVADWLPYVLVAQLSLLVLCSWFAVRQATRPLADLAKAADTLDPNSRTPRLSETGPREVAYAATAFNAMRDRIAQYLEERVQILAAISHDLQTPITRMKLRAEMAEASIERDKLITDLDEVERLVKEGVAYARSAHGKDEKASRIDLASFIESLAYDYQDTGKAVTVAELGDGAIVTRPHALRRILTNLIDNALKFGGSAEIEVQRRPEGTVTIKVLDHGPGIPEDQLEAVLQPFFRLEQSRSRDTGGTGLGLAIAQQLATVIGGSLTLRNRDGGGLAAELSLESSTVSMKQWNSLAL